MYVCDCGVQPLQKGKVVIHVIVLKSSDVQHWFCLCTIISDSMATPGSDSFGSQKQNTQSLFHVSDQWLQRLNQNVQVKVRFFKNRFKRNTYPYVWKLPNFPPKKKQPNVIYSPNQQPPRCAMQWQVLRAIGRWIGPWVNMRNAIAWFASMIRINFPTWRCSDFPTDWLGRKPIVV